MKVKALDCDGREENVTRAAAAWLSRVASLWSSSTSRRQLDKNTATHSRNHFVGRRRDGGPPAQIPLRRQELPAARRGTPGGRVQAALG